MFLGFLGRNLHTHNLAFARRLGYAHAGKFMHADELFQKLQFYFSIFASAFTCMFLFSLFRIFMLSKLLFHMYYLFVCFSQVRIRVSLMLFVLI